MQLCVVGNQSPTVDNLKLLLFTIRLWAVKDYLTMIDRSRSVYTFIMNN